MMKADDVRHLCLCPVCGKLGDERAMVKAGPMEWLAHDRTALKADLGVMYDASSAMVGARRRRAMALARTIQNPIRPYFILRGSGAAIRPAAAGAKTWDVADLCAVYSWPTGLAGGGVIGIIELGGGWVQSDIDAYFAKANLPKPTVVDVLIGGANNPTPTGDPATNPDGEVALDIEVASAAYSVATGAPATIRVYWADGSDWGSMATAVAAAAADGCDVCSISWGTDEANWLAAGASAGVDYAGKLNAAVQAAAAAGMTVFAAAGDNDSGDGGPNPANVDLPSSSPFVIGCGGTMKPHGGGEETVWNNDPGNPNGEGTGGGFSTIFVPMPLWQAGAPHGPGRMVPDVAANADPNTGYNIVVHGQPLSFGGTSAVAPLYAGLFAAFGRKLSLATPQPLITSQLWLNQTCFTDIVTGDNGFFRASAGPDPCTGIGSPIGLKLAALFGAKAAAQLASQAAVSAPDARHEHPSRKPKHVAHKRHRAHAEG